MIIAEVGSVHDGSLGNALKLIDLASESKADCIKFQYHIACEETLENAPNPYYFKEESRFQYFKRIEFNFKQWSKIIKYCKQKKIKFMCSVFSEKALENLIKLGVKNIKIPSGEISNLFLLNKLNKYKKINLFLSTGMSSWKEIDKAINLLKNSNLILMQCTSLYPCPPEKVGINIIMEMKKRYGKIKHFGFSDHTEGVEAAILALNSGATVFEKHITFSKKMYGSDARFAMEPEEFKNYVKSINNSKKILKKKVDKDNINSFKKMKEVFEKKIVTKKKLKKGMILNENNLKFLKAKGGLFSSKLEFIFGKKVKKNLKKNIVLKLSDIY